MADQDYGHTQVSQLAIACDRKRQDRENMFALMDQHTASCRECNHEWECADMRYLVAGARQVQHDYQAALELWRQAAYGSEQP